MATHPTFCRDTEICCLTADSQLSSGQEMNCDLSTPVTLSLTFAGCFDTFTYWCSNDRLLLSSRLRLNDCTLSMSVYNLDATVDQVAHRVGQRGVKYPV